jgi:Zn finger protein HypA/HybF involved in hydrogenase expression
MSEIESGAESIGDGIEIDSDDDESNCERCGHPAYAKDQEPDDETLCPDCIAERHESPWKFGDIEGREHEFD